MNRKNIPTYALVVGVAAVAAIWAGVPASTILLFALVLACPLMMLFMHGGGHRDHGAGPERHDPPATHHYHAPDAGPDRSEPIDPITRR